MVLCENCEKSRGALCDTCDALVSLECGERSEHQIAVEGFLTAIGREVPTAPQVPDLKVIEAWARMLLEEVWEYFDAAGVEITIEEECRERELRFEDFSIRVRHASQDFPAMVDANADIAVINTGCLSLAGVQDDRVMALVDANNMLKIKHGHRDEASGKWIKPKNHPKPDFAKLLKEMGWKGSDA